MNHSQRLTESLLENGPYVRSAAPFGLVSVAGPDAGDFLQRLCSQDVKALAEGQSAPAAFLDAKGKVVATCLVQRLARDGEDVFWLDTQAAQQGRIAQLLDRYHFTEKLAISSAGPGSMSCDEWIGPQSAAAPERDEGVQFSWTRCGVQFVRRHAERGAVQRAWDGAPLDPDRADCLRMAAGIVEIGLDTEASTLALEAFLEDHCSTSKGCYTGQEIVARIHTYGHTNRNLCLLELAAGPRLLAPVVLHECEDDLPVGRVMAAAPLPDGSRRLGLGYLPKDFQDEGVALRLAGGGDAVVVRAFVGAG